MNGISVVGRPLAAALFLTLSGCVLDTTSAADGPGEEPAGEQRQTLVTHIGFCPQCLLPLLCNPLLSDDCCDPSKYESCSLQAEGPDADVKVKLYQCRVVGPENYRIDTHCEVEPGWTVIGGGGQVLDADADDVKLAISYPEAGYFFPEDDMRGARKWRVATGRREEPRPHRLKPYAIGIKLRGYDNVNHFAPLRVTSSGWTTKELARPSTTVKVRPGDILLGGGFSLATLRPSLGPSLGVVRAYAEGMLEGTWHAAASNVGNGSLGDINGVAISIDSCPDRWSSCFSARKNVTEQSSTGTGLRTATPQSPGGGYLLTGMGFWSNNWNRPLNAMLQVPGGARISTIGDASGHVTGQALHLRR
jgi:hypothetical protein